MVDGNISMEEDTELRDLVVQTLENNGVLAKVRAELRASVFLALEEQDSVMNAEPLLNKTVKEYLECSEGKLLFSLVREFLEYFGLDYTISVYDPETYFGKEYNYIGRNELCEELGISSTEPLLGEILKNNINGALITSRKNTVSHNRLNKTDETSTHLNNATFEINLPKVYHKDSTADWNNTDISENIESYSQSTSQIPFNVTIADNNKCENALSTLKDSPNHKSNNVSNTVSAKMASDVSTYNEFNNQDNYELNLKQKTLNKNEKTEATVKVSVDNNGRRLEKINVSSVTEACITNLISAKDEEQTIQTENTSEQKFVEADTLRNKTDSLLGELPPLISRSNSVLSDILPLNYKKSNLNDLKELMQIATDAADNYDEDFISSASGSANEQSPSKQESGSPLKPQFKREETVFSEKLIHSEEISEEIEDIISSKSFLEAVADKKISKLTVDITADCVKEV